MQRCTKIYEATSHSSASSCIVLLFTIKLNKKTPGFHATFLLLLVRWEPTRNKKLKKVVYLHGAKHWQGHTFKERKANTDFISKSDELNICKNALRQGTVCSAGLGPWVNFDMVINPVFQVSVKKPHNLSPGPRCTKRALRIPDRRHGWHGHPWQGWCTGLTLSMICCDIG